MAIDATVTDIVQEINDARVDMQSFASFMFEPANVMITRRLAPDTHSLQHYLDYLDAIKLVFTQESGDVTVGDKTIKTVSQLIADGEQQTSDAVADINTRADTAIGNANTSLNNAIDVILRAGGHVGYPTLAAATADKANITVKTIVEITNDTTANNGIYLYNGTSFIKSAYDPIAVAKTYTDTQLAALNINVVSDIARADETAKWQSFGSNITASDGGLLSTSTGSHKDPLVRTPLSAKVDNSYLIRAKVKVNSPECRELQFSLENTVGGIYTISDLTVGEYIDISFIRKTTATASSLLYIYHTYDSADISNTKSITIKDASVINLTELFPKGIPELGVIESVLGDAVPPFTLNGHDLANSAISLSKMNTLKLASYETEISDSVELFDGRVYTGGVYRTGVITTSGLVRYTGFLNVSEFKQIELSGFQYDELGYAFYDKDYDFISFGSAYRGGLLNGVLDVPPNAVYFAKTIISQTSKMEDLEVISIKGLFAADKLSAYALDKDTVSLSSSDKNEQVRTSIWSVDKGTVEGRYSDAGIVETGAGNLHTAPINVADYNTLDFANFSDATLKRYWLDRDGAVLTAASNITNTSMFRLNGEVPVPAGAKHLVVNVKNNSTDDTDGIVYGIRKVNSSDFQRKGASGGVEANGFEVVDNVITTDKDIEIYNARNPEILPLIIRNQGISAAYPHYGDKLGTNVFIAREAWGMQQGMNAHKVDPTMVSTKDYTKELMSQNGLVAELGMEGFSWHVVPPNLDWGESSMMLKIGGTNVRSEKNSGVANKSMLQLFAPTWSERRDYGVSNSWARNSTSASSDAAIPTRIMIRQTEKYDSPEYYRISYSDTQNASWDRFSRARGTIKAPEVLQHGDSIHKQVFSVSTGQASLGEAMLNNVAEIDVRYKDDGSDESAEIVFRVWNKTTEQWVEKLVL